jgi:hypothetical protein
MFVGPLRVRIPDVSKPLDLGRNVGQALEFGGGEEPGFDHCFDWDFGRNHRHMLVLIKSVIKSKMGLNL